LSQVSHSFSLFGKSSEADFIPIVLNYAKQKQFNSPAYLI